MNEADAEPELYVPRPGIVAWKVLDYLVRNPNEELTRGDVAVKFDCIGGGVDTLLQLAVARGALKKSRNGMRELTWILGDLTRFRLDPMPPSGAAAPPAAASTPTREPAIKVVQLEQPPKDAKNETVGQGAQPAEPWAKSWPGELSAAAQGGPEPGPATPAPVMVPMPLQLTPELIEAVKSDPATSFDNKADGHHAIGWLMDAWAVMVKRQQQAVRP